MFANGKLIYFDVYMKAEPIRMILNHAGVNYFDYRIKDELEFQQMKKEGLFPAGQVPVFICADGRVLN